MIVNGVFFNVELCLAMGKRRFIRDNAVHFPDMGESERKELLAKIWSILKDGEA